jgi:hypothetical protein
MDKDEQSQQRDKLNQLTTEFMSQMYRGQTSITPRELTLHLWRVKR